MKHHGNSLFLNFYFIFTLLAMLLNFNDMIDWPVLACFFLLGSFNFYL